MVVPARSAAAASCSHSLAGCEASVKDRNFDNGPKKVRSRFHRFPTEWRNRTAVADFEVDIRFRTLDRGIENLAA